MRAAVAQDATCSLAAPLGRLSSSAFSSEVTAACISISWVAAQHLASTCCCSTCIAGGMIRAAKLPAWPDTKRAAVRSSHASGAHLLLQRVEQGALGGQVAHQQQVAVGVKLRVGEVHQPRQSGLREGCARAKQQAGLSVGRGCLKLTGMPVSQDGLGLSSELRMQPGAAARCVQPAGPVRRPARHPRPRTAHLA